jgi:hypothetical protein
MKAVDAFPEIKIPAEERAIFYNGVYTIRIAKDGAFVSQNSICDKIGFVEWGEMRSVTVIDRKSLVIARHFKHQFASVFSGILTGEPSNVLIQATRPSKLTVIPGSLLFLLIERHPCWVEYWLNIMGAQLQCLSQQEKYRMTKSFEI